MSGSAAQAILVREDFAANKAPEASEPRLRMAGVTKQWDARQRPVLEDVSLALPPSTVMLLTGRNGVGKTTLLRIVAGVITPDRGTVAVDELRPLRDRRAYSQRVGFLSAHQGSLYPRLTAAQHLDFCARITFIPKRLRPTAIEYAVDRFALADFLARRADRISMGQRQRLRLALTFLHRPGLILLDEPRNSLDAEGIALLLDVLKDSRAQGCAVIWCAPAADDAPEPDLLLELDGGKLVRR